MSERKPGWYHIRTGQGWECARWERGCWFIVGTGFAYDDGDFEEIGPRIPTPDEMERWQLVPRAPTPDMLEKGVDMLDVTDNLIPTYQAMLWAAPNPEDS